RLDVPQAEIVELPSGAADDGCGAVGVRLNQYRLAFGARAVRTNSDPAGAWRDRCLDQFRFRPDGSVAARVAADTRLEKEHGAIGSRHAPMIGSRRAPPLARLIVDLEIPFRHLRAVATLWCGPGVAGYGTRLGVVEYGKDRTGPERSCIGAFFILVSLRLERPDRSA